MASVRLHGVEKRYGATHAVHALDLDIRDGEFLSILGPSGSGKTTLLRIIAGFVEPNAGRVEIGGRDVTRLSADHRNLGVVFQSYALFPHMSVLDNVGFGLRMRGAMRSERRRRAAEALALVGLAGYEDRLPRQLSGGQQQRVALARATVVQPDVLLLDEPLGALDLKLRKSMQLELKQLHQQLRQTFVYITHDQEEALTMSDRIAVMDAGRIQQIDTSAAIYERPETPFVAEFLGDSNLLAGSVRAGLSGALVFEAACGLTVPLTSSAGGTDGRTVLAVRPERVFIPSGFAVGDELRVTATVETLVFRGAWISLLTRLADGSRFEAHIPNDGRTAGALPAAGMPVVLAFQAADARLIGRLA